MEDAHGNGLENLVHENVGLIEQGVDLITSIHVDQYRNNTNALFTSGVGRHFRHILDFYDRLLRGHSSLVDYDARHRDERIETDPDFACRAARTIAGALRALGDLESTSDGITPLRVRTEVQASAGVGLEVSSTLERELSVLASHTVHHFAIIALLLRIQGADLPPDFGVAPSTLRYQASRSH